MGLVLTKKLDISQHEIGVIGDRRFTDVSFGLASGAGRIALCNKVGSGDARFVPTLRLIERIVVGAERLYGNAQ